MSLTSLSRTNLYRHHIVDVPLKSLELLSREVKELAKGTAAISMSMLGDPYRQLNSILLFLHAQVFNILPLLGRGPLNVYRFVRFSKVTLIVIQ